MDKETLQDWLAWSFSPSISAILITLLVSLLSPILVHLYLYRSKTSAVVPTFMLVGPSGAGKTTLLTQVHLMVLCTKAQQPRLRHERALC